MRTAVQVFSMAPSDQVAPSLSILRAHQRVPPLGLLVHQV